MRSQQPLFKSGPFSITANGLVTSRRPTAEEWAPFGKTLALHRGATNWSIGDWMLIGDECGLDDGVVETAAEATGLKRGTLHNMKSIARAFPPAARAHEVPWSHYALVAGFDDEQRGELLARAAAEKLSWEAMQAICRLKRQVKNREWQKFPEGTFGVIVARPPWQRAPYEDTPADAPRAMNEHEIAGLAPAVQGIAAPGCVLYLHATSFRLEEAFEVMQVWGFKYASHHVVMHDLLGPGLWNLERHHLVLVGTRGNPAPPLDDARFDSLLTEGELIHRLDHAYADVPKVLLFERETVIDGWTVWGERLDGMTPTTPGRALRVRREDVSAVLA